MMSPIRVVFMGTPGFAVHVLRALADNPQIRVTGVVTQPDRPVGRKRELTPPPVKQAALSLGLLVLQPSKVRAEEALATIADLQPDVLVTAAYGQLLPQRLLDLPKHGCLNVHASLLPRWRGAAPIHRALMAGDSETGVTIMKTVLAMDAGPIVAVRRTPILPTDDTGSLHDKLALLGAEALNDVLPDYVAGRVEPVPQPEAGVTYANRIERQDEYLDWNRPVGSVDCHIRGLSPWPVACTRWEGTVLKVWRAVPAAPAEGITVPPGTVREVPGTGICVRCADGWLRLLEVQPAGKKRLDATEWFRGVHGGEIHFETVVDDR